MRPLVGKPGACSSLPVFDTLFCFLVLAEYIRFMSSLTSEASNFLVWGLDQTGGQMLLSLMGLDSYMAVCRPPVFLRLKDPELQLSLCLLVCAITGASCGLVKTINLHHRDSQVSLQIRASLEGGPSSKEVDVYYNQMGGIFYYQLS